MERIVEQEVLPHVYSLASSAMSAMSLGGRFALPLGTKREISDVSRSKIAWGKAKFSRQTFEEVTIPPTKPIPQKRNERPVRIADLPPMAKGCFPVSELIALEFH